MKERKKIAIKKAIRNIVCYDLIYLLLGIGIVIYDKDVRGMFFLVGYVLVILVFDVLAGTGFYAMYIYQEEERENVEFVEKYIAEKQYIQVIPLKESCSEVIYNLTNFAEFYAYLDNNEITIYVKLKNEEKMQLLERVCIEKFADYYELKEKNS